MSRYEPKYNLSLQDEIEQAQAEIERHKVMKLQTANHELQPAEIDQEAMRYEDIPLHPEDCEMLRAQIEEEIENQRLRDEYHYREWLLKMVDFAP